MALSSDYSIIVQTIVDLLKTDTSLRLKDVFYGDQELIPRVPAVTVEGGLKRRSYNQTGLQTNVDLSVFITVFHGGVKDKSVLQKDIDERTQLIEAALHGNPKLTTTSNTGGYVIHSLVVSNEPGFITRGRTVFLASRLTWEGLVKERIGV